MKTIVALALVVLVAAPARADRPGADGAKMTAVAWLGAPRAQPPAIDDAVAMTEVPFWYAGAAVGEGDACKAIGAAGDVADRAKLGPVLACLAQGTGDLLGKDATWTVIDAAHVPARFGKARARLAAMAKGHALVLGHAPGKRGDAWAVIAVAYDPAASATTVGAFAFVRAHR